MKYRFNVAVCQTTLSGLAQSAILMTLFAPPHRAGQGMPTAANRCSS
jgi:hypothetical protein